MLFLFAAAAGIAAGPVGAPAERAFDGCPGGTVYFAAGSAELDTEALNWLSFAFSAFLQPILREGDGGSWIHVTGFTDAREAAAAAAGLDRRRAESVRHFLVRRGPPASRARASAGGVGDASPTSSGAETGAAQRSASTSIEMDEPTWRRLFPPAAPIC